MRIPTTSVLKLYFGYGTLLYGQFFLVYGLTNWLASTSDHYYMFYFEWEANTPFYSAFIVPYLSLSLFLILPVFYLDEGSISRWAKSYMYMIFVAGIVFLLFPTVHLYERYINDDMYYEFFKKLYALDLSHNLFPSLHIALTSLAVLIIWPSITSLAMQVFVFIWWVLMVLSVILIRQHHVADIVAGFVLAYISYKLIYLNRKA